MRKRLILLLVITLLLCGCEREIAQEATLPEQTQTTVHEEPTGLYQPNSDPEISTGGAVRCYLPEQEDILYLDTMGDTVVIFSGKEQTTLTSLAGENLYIQGQVTLPFLLEGGVSGRCTEKGLSYRDTTTGELVLLDTALKEIRRVALPEDAVGEPLLSADRRTLYYCTASSIRVMDLETGIRRLMKQISYPQQELKTLLLEETVLHCAVTDENGTQEHLFLDTQTGETLIRFGRELSVNSDGPSWFARVEDGSVFSLLTGEGECVQLYPRDITSEGFLQPKHHTAVTVSTKEQTVLDRYDLRTGLRTATAELSGTVRQITAGDQGEYIWFLLDDAQGGVMICRWDTSATPVDDGFVYTGPRYTPDAPDIQGLAACAAEAEAMGEKYGVEILIGMDAVNTQPVDFEAQAEFSVPVIRVYLQELEHVLSVYPEGFFRTAMTASDSGKLKICLVRSLSARPYAANFGEVAGDQFWEGREAYLFLTAQPGLERVFYHEMCHAMETQVFAKSGRYDDWDKLNPEDFSYDFDYLANAKREGGRYLEGQDRAFIDTFSMSFPKEDRATVMTYAMTEGNEELFRSETMQKKLVALCKGIREAFGWKKSEEVFLWEQYLEEPMAYQPNK